MPTYADLIGPSSNSELFFRARVSCEYCSFVRVLITVGTRSVNRPAWGVRTVIELVLSYTGLIRSGSVAV